MNIKWLLAIAGLLLLIGIGGKIYLDKRADQQELDLIEAEKMSVEALKQRYENIKLVEFEKSGYDKKTGAYTMFVKMTNNENKSVSFSYTFWENQSKIGSALLNNRDVQVKGVTTNKVKIIHSNKDEDEV